MSATDIISPPNAGKLHPHLTGLAVVASWRGGWRENVESGSLCATYWSVKRASHDGAHQLFPSCEHMVSAPSNPQRLLCLQSCVNLPHSGVAQGEFYTSRVLRHH